MRPSKYDPKYINEMLAHFNQPLYVIKEKETASGGRLVKVKVECPNSMPTFERFALNIGVIHDTLRNWCKEYPEFFCAYNACKDIQKSFITEHGMMGNYNPGFAKFIAVNVTDLKDKVTHEIGPASKPIQVLISQKENEL